MTNARLTNNNNNYYYCNNHNVIDRFFRWLSERYPKINQRMTLTASDELSQAYYQRNPPAPLDPPDPLSTCGLPPPIDRLYIDMNGILHGCSHNNMDELGTSTLSEDDIFKNVCFYLERIVGEMVEPKTLVYMAIDGVAPRAKMNQQRSRRYRSSDGGEIEQTVFEAHQQSKLHQQGEAQVFRVSDDTLSITKEGYVSGKFETHQEAISTDDTTRQFHSNSITPGTTFFANCQTHLEHFIQYKLSTDPKWQALTIIFSGSHVPGEGEHKIMDFMRRERARPDYDPNTRHCIVGQDGDLIMLGLATHEPNLVLLRERVVFDMTKNARNKGIDAYVFNPHFEFLHLNVLRDYLAYEFETAPLVAGSVWDLERTVDDFVFLTFFCGNDFLPHLPAVDIGDEAFDLLFYTYKRSRRAWQQESGKDEYLTHRGTICSGERLEQFLQQLGSHETPYYDNKKEKKSRSDSRIRNSDSEAGRGSTIPPEEILKLKEEDDRASYRDMLAKANIESAKHGFAPVLSGQDLSSFKASTDDEEMEEGFFARLGKMVQSSLSQPTETNSTGPNMTYEFLDDQDLKGRYYYDKFRFTPFDANKHIALRKAYLEGLVWNLKYYYEGCVSWEWFYPFHYGPMLSDIVNVEQMLPEVSFEGKMGEPLKPFEQLMGCMPPSSAYMLPKPYRWLMTEEDSPVNEFYPKTFTVDMNGKRWPWEAVVLLPFIDSKRLIHAARNFVKDDQLTDEERKRNALGNAVVFTHDPSIKSSVPRLKTGANCFDAIDECTAKITPLESTDWDFKTKEPVVFEPVLKEGIVFPQPGFSSLRVAPTINLWRRRVGLNIFGMRSRYKTAVLQLDQDSYNSFPPLEILAPKLIGAPIFINYPHLLEGFVTSMSNEEMSIRGREPPQIWSKSEQTEWVHRSNTLTNRLEYGEGFTGTGGWNLPASPIILTVRPIKEVRTNADGKKVKKYAKFEVEVPLIAGLWSPVQYDPRVWDIPARFEKDAFFVNKTRRTASLDKSSWQSSSELLPGDLLPDADKAFEGPVITSLSDFFVSGEHTHECLLPPMEMTSNVSSKLSSGGSTLLPSMDAASLLGGSQRSFSSRTTPRPFLNPRKKRTFSTSARTVRSSAPRGRVLAIVGAAVMFATGMADAAGVASSALFGIRGGGGDIASPFHSTTPPPLEFAHGTTTLSFVFKGGIIAAVDSRASLGNFVGSKTVQKVLCINTHLLGTMAGGAADCLFWIRKVKAQADLLEVSTNKRMSVARASRILSNALYENRGLDLSVGTMIMGQDENGLFSIYYVDNSGVRIKGDMFACGSGSTFALGILDPERKFDMTEDDAIALGVKAIRHATFRDAYSGGFIGVYLITKDGWRKVFSEDLAGGGASNNETSVSIEWMENEQETAQD
jgi:5'-3' exonuclease/20S proteasome alpha/beta subunit